MPFILHPKDVAELNGCFDEIGKEIGSQHQRQQWAGNTNQVTARQICTKVGLEPLAPHFTIAADVRFGDVIDYSFLRSYFRIARLV